MFKFFGLLVIVGVAGAIEYPLLSHGHAPLIHAAPALIAKPVLKYATPLVKTVEVEAPAHYDFSYSVHDDHTGDIKSQTESRKGDIVQGQYTLIDADGYLRTVDYTSDAHNGFNAVVRRDPLGHKVVKAIAPVAKVLAPIAPIHSISPIHSLAPIAHIGGPKLLAAPLIPKLAVAAPSLSHVSVAAPAYSYSH